MPDQKISDMTSASSLSGTEMIEVVQGGVNKKTTLQDVANLGDIVDHYRGDWSNSSALPDVGSNGNLPDGSPIAGDRWRLTVDLTLSGNFYPAGTIIEAATDTPGQTRSTWNFYAQLL